MKINSYKIYRFLGFILDKKPKTVKMYFYRKGWSTTDPDKIIKYILKFK